MRAADMSCSVIKERRLLRRKPLPALEGTSVVEKNKAIMQQEGEKERPRERKKEGVKRETHQGFEGSKSKKGIYVQY